MQKQKGKRDYWYFWRFIIKCNNRSIFKNLISSFFDITLPNLLVQGVSLQVQLFPRTLLNGWRAQKPSSSTRMEVHSKCSNIPVPPRKRISTRVFPRWLNGPNVDFMNGILNFFNNATNFEFGHYHIIYLTLNVLNYMVSYVLIHLKPICHYIWREVKVLIYPYFYRDQGKKYFNSSRAKILTQVNGDGYLVIKKTASTFSPIPSQE